VNGFLYGESTNHRSPASAALRLGRLFTFLPNATSILFTIHRSLFTFFTLLLFLSACRRNDDLDARIRAEIQPFKGKVWIYAKNLDTGKTYSLDGDLRVRTASTIKLAIMVEAFARVAEGRAHWSDEIIMTKEKKQPDGGVLQELADGTRLTLRDVVNLMIVVSDNTGANLALDFLTADAVNARMDSLGLKSTRSLRKIGGGGESKAYGDPVNKGFGIGVSTPHEMVSLMEKLEHGEIVSPEVSREMIALLKRQQYHLGIGRSLNSVEIEIASKFGSLDALRSDVGIIYSKRGPIAMAITCDQMPEVDWTEDNPAYHLMSDLSNILIDGLGR
jgi:beta-lactamase class A